MVGRGRRLRLLAAITVIAICLFASFSLPGGGPVERAPAAKPPTQPQGLRVYVVVLDGLRPSEVTPSLMPNLSELRSHGTWYEQARSVFIAETLPNHASMMTGVTPDRHAVVGNRLWQPNGGGVQRYDVGDLGPRILEAETLTTRLENTCQSVSTATVLSKRYLYELFQGEPPAYDPVSQPNPFTQGEPMPGDPIVQRQADYHWNPINQPGYVPYPSEHATDQSTMNIGFLPWFRAGEPTPQFAFVNLGDIDRSGHADESGIAATGGLTAFRQAAITDTDVVIGDFVDELKSTGAWDETVLIFTSDHGMDWAAQDKDMNVERAAQREGYGADDRGNPGRAPGSGSTKGAGDYWGTDNGGAAMLYVEDDADVVPIAKIVAAQPGVEFIATKTSIPELGNPTLAELGLDHPYAGDIVAFAKPGWAERTTFTSSNPLPGNHGHPATQNSVLMVSGGHPALDDVPQSVGGETVYDPVTKPRGVPPVGGPGNLSVAPTVAALFGIGEPAGGYDAAPLREAFDRRALKRTGPCG